MDSSRIKCAKCEQILNNTDIIYSTTQCGHLFHGTCLRAKSICPKCGGVCYPRYHRRIYPTFNTYNWMYINTQTTNLDGEDCSPFALELGTTGKGQPIYAARLCGKDKTNPIYYVPDERRSFEDITCSRPCIDILDIEILDISRDKYCHYKSLVEEIYKLNGETQTDTPRLQRSESVRMDKDICLFVHSLGQKHSQNKVDFK